MPFMNGQGLFLTESIGKAHIMREMRDDFGILPYPKYDAARTMTVYRQFSIVSAVTQKANKHQKTDRA